MTKQDPQRIVAIDSMTLVWGVSKKGDPDGIKHAKYLFMQLNEEKAQIVIPSVVVAEYITPCSSRREREEVVAALGERFIIAPFDAKDAIEAADLWNCGKRKRERKRPGARVRLRADTLIIATAHNHGAQVFYTDDQDCFTMASRIMQAKHLPTIPPNLFADQEE